MHCKALIVAASLLATTVLGKTNLTGDIVDGIPVITALDLADVPVNAITRYYFLAGVAQGTINYHVPVFVARGTNSSLHTGRRLSISSTVHGDEYNGVRVVQNVFGLLEKTVKAGKFNGTIIGIPTVNMNGIMHNQRNFFSSSENGFFTNLNRVFPGIDPNDPAEQADNPSGYAYRIWKDLWGNTTNVDVAVDLHELTTGSDGPMWVYSDYRLPYNSRLATLAQPDIIKIDPGEPGSIETTWVENSIPCITLELGPPVSWGHEYIQRGQDFIFRLLADLRMTPPAGSPYNNNPSPNSTATVSANGEIVPDLSKTYISTNRVDIPTTKAGWAQALVHVLDDVAKDQALVHVYNSWGDLLETVRAPDDSRVLQVKTDPAVEQGAIVIVLVNNSTST